MNVLRSGKLRFKSTPLALFLPVKYPMLSGPCGARVHRGDKNRVSAAGTGHPSSALVALSCSTVGKAGVQASSTTHHKDVPFPLPQQWGPRRSPVWKGFRPLPGWRRRSLAWYLLGSHFVPVGVHGGHDVDARVVEEAGDALAAPAVLLAQELGELQQQLAAQHLVPVHVPDVLELRLHCREQHSSGTISWGWGWRSPFPPQGASASPRDPQ